MTAERSQVVVSSWGIFTLGNCAENKPRDAMRGRMSTTITSGQANSSSREKIFVHRSILFSDYPPHASKQGNLHSQTLTFRRRKTRSNDHRQVKHVETAAIDRVAQPSPNGFPQGNFSLLETERDAGQRYQSVETRSINRAHFPTTTPLTAFQKRTLHSWKLR